MKKILYIIIAIAAAMLSSCQEPEDLVPAQARNGINSVTAYFLYDDREENEFGSEIDYENGIITIVFPYTYPANTESHLEMDDLKKVKVVAELDDNVVVDPPLLIMDLTRDDNYITVTDQRKQKKTYHIVAEIRKSNLCQILKFELPSINVAGVINEGAKTISLIYDSDIPAMKAEAKLSFGASFTGTDPTKTAVAYPVSTPVSLTVVAQDGVTTATYTVSISTPDILDKGMRYGSEKMLWHVNLATLGIGNTLLTGGMAVVGDKIVLNTRDEDMVVLNAETGAKVGTIALDFKGNLANFYCTADNNDNILISNFVAKGSSDKLTVYRLKGIGGAPTKYIEFDSGGLSVGRKISVIGSLDSDAIITAPIYQEGTEFYRWTVTGGVLDPTPAHVVMADENIAAWNYACDIIYSSPTDVTSDYFVASYSAITGGDRNHLWMDGKTNKIKYMSPNYSGNWVPNAVDYIVFNGASFIVCNTVNAASWGADDVIYLYDLSKNNLDETAWQCEKGVYGSFATNSLVNANYTGDVALRLSNDGYYMYIYFMFSGGQIAKVQFDCLNM
ncbi:MAG: DUF5018 domain-containing protein [Bacteroidales bacterium]|nr:DUF5018 domain-containing protein [Bacteroidales bacterium]